MQDETQPVNTVWELHLRQHNLPLNTPMPRDIRTAPSAQADDPIRRCRHCGGEWFNATVIMAADGTPVRMIPPQKCVGCGAIGQHDWTLDGPS